jgi:hypothetical protein
LGDREQAESGVLALAAVDLPGARGVSAARPEAIAVLAERVDAWAERFGSHESRGTSHEGLTAGTALVTVLRAAAEEAPVLVWIDDAHFLDGPFGFWAIPRTLAGLW